mmetsp:Transcript_20371/g.31446  ORF Transcript_20371/g.31446 Transcript_20371/m.31446 type:complete len:498 (-) Transcript_20371:2905-4398(-)
MKTFVVFFGISFAAFAVGLFNIVYFHSSQHSQDLLNQRHLLERHKSASMRPLVKKYVAPVDSDLGKTKLRKDTRKPKNSNTNTNNDTTERNTFSSSKTLKHRFDCPQNQPMPRPEHGCRSSSKSMTVYCQAKNLRVDVSLIQESSAVGGEELSTVMGRDEQSEYLVYSRGAFSTPTPLDVPADLNREKAFYLNEVLSATETATKTCAETRSNPTLFITRYEYVNLYHTMTDWFNAVVMHPRNLNGAKVDVIFLDAHAKGNLDSVWSRLFGGTVEYVKHLPKGGVCFENAIFVPPGYSSMIYVNNNFYDKSHACKGLVKDFVSFVLQSYNLQNVKMVPRRIVIIDRVPYVAHPRSQVGSKLVDRSISNLHKLEKRLNKMPGVDARLVQLEKLEFGDQVRLIREAELLIGNHGAGLSHLLFMHNNANVLEFESDSHFSEFAQWRGIAHHSIFYGYHTSLSNNFVRFVLIPEVESILKLDSSVSKKMTSLFGRIFGRLFV